MADIVDVATRSRMMSGIRGQDTKPEMIIRRGLHRRGLRYNLHQKRLSGKPDLVLPAYSTLIFVNGCFWHHHDCSYFKLPQSNRKFWRDKLRANKKRDERNVAALLEDNWYVAVVWECSVRNKTKEKTSLVIDRLDAWIRKTKYRKRFLEIVSQRRSR